MEKIGEGVMVEEKAVRDEMRKKGEAGFVSDHLGLCAEMRFKGSKSLMSNFSH